MMEQQFLDDAMLQLRKLKAQADKAISQTSDEHFFAIMKHMAGNMRSRWTDFLTTDGEKPDRDRDREFETSGADTRASVTALWEDGWSRLFSAITPLSPADLSKMVQVRREAHSVLEAINRQMTHYAAHIGQIVLLAKHYAGADWQTLSIPRGKSKEFDVSKTGAAYGVRDSSKK
jgi:hypothetical protein